MKSSPLSRLVTMASVNALCLLNLVNGQAANSDGTLNQPTAGTYQWDTDTNWVGNTIADGSGFTATFNTAAGSGNFIVNEATDRTIGNLTFQSSRNWTLQGAGKITLAGGSTPTISTVGATTISSVLDGNQGFTLSSGNLTLSGDNLFTGLVTVTGSLTLAHNKALGSTTGDTRVSGVLTLNNGITVTGETLDLRSASSLGGLKAAGNATAEWAGNVIINIASARIGGDAGGILKVSGVIASGTHNDLVISTNGTVTLAGANTYTGETQIIRGTVKLDGGNNRLPTGTVLNFNTFGNGVFDLNGYHQTVAGLSRGIIGAFTADLTNSGAAATFTINNSATRSYTGSITGNLALTKTGVGNQTLIAASANTFTGLTTISVGTLTYGSNNVIGSGGITVNGGTLALSTFTDTVGTVTLTSGSITGSGTLTSTGSYEMQSGSVSAVLAGSGIALNKTTGGTVTFTGANTYTGDTLVSEGTLVLSGGGSIANSATVNVASGATLSTSGITFGAGQTVKGNGTITGNTILEGTLAAGNSPGLLTFSNSLELASSTNSIFEIGGGTPVRGVTYDGVTVGSQLTYNGTLTLDFTALSSGATYNLFDFSSVAGDFTSVVFDGGIYAGSFTQNAGFWTASSNGQVFSFGLASGDLIVSAIPEPSTTLLLTGALTALVIFRRRRR